MQINASITSLPSNVNTQELKKALETGKIQEVEVKGAETTTTSASPNLSKAGIEMLTKSSTDTVHTSENAVRVTTSEGTQGLLKALDQLVNLEKYKLPEASKALITAFIKAQTGNSDIKQGLSVAIQSQKDLAKSLLSLSNGVLTDLFSSEDLASADKNTQKQILDKFAQRIENFIKQAEQPVKEQITQDSLPKAAENLGEKNAPQTSSKEGANVTQTPKALSENKDTAATVLPNKATVSTETAAKLAVEVPQTPKMGSEMPAKIASDGKQELGQKSTGETEKNINKPQETASGADKTASVSNEKLSVPIKNDSAATAKGNEQGLVKEPDKAPVSVKEQLKETLIKENIPKEGAADKGQVATTSSRQSVANKYEDLQPKLSSNNNLTNNSDKTQEVTNLVRKLVLVEETLKQGNLLKSDTLEKFLAGKDNLTETEQNEIGSRLKEFLPRLLNPKEGESVENLVKDIINKNRLPNTESGENAALTKLLENANKLNNIQKQVSNLTENIKEMASSLVKNINVGSEQTGKSLQGSFILLMNLAEEQQAKPVYVHLYHERESKSDNKQDLSAQTWLKVSLDYEYSGLVTAIFHLWQGNVLDIKVNFPEPEAADCFNSFVPEIIKNMSSSKLQLNNITLAR